MIRRYGEPPVKGQRYSHRPGVYAVLLRGRSLLVTHQADPDDEFQLPGGGVDPGEQPLAALHREVFEETGWSMGKPVRLGAFRRFAYMPEYDRWAEKLCTIYLARPLRDLGPPTEPGHTALWMPIEVACDRLDNAGDRAFVRQVASAL
ncbi:NUDIX hydrolase [Anianabacter salinae]|uniref:NUDIX hydrolase n=1 Tax=Anianabacter salinae TaxID=2851023 RepID=UPI00225DFAC9|nr:NUDIX hydrolase [Anianabacter salinae]MBV0913538.1 NUDIX hydrolase [Anianabacter salinae]